MASPAEPIHPLTPPAEPSVQAQTQASFQNTQNTNTSTTASSLQPALTALLSQPSTSLTDDGTSRRPRDHRLIHLLLASHGVAAYQERVPLQLMDFAYRYTNSILSDALHIQNEGYDQADSAGAASSKGRGNKTGAGHGKAGAGAGEDVGDISLQALRLATAARMSYQFQGAMPKDFLKGLAEERNRIGLGVGLRDNEKAGPTVGGVRLPHERYCLTGVGWGLKEEWESEGEESVEDEMGKLSDGGDNGDAMQMDGADELEEDEEGETMEDVFGPNDGDPGDEEMGDS